MIIAALLIAFLTLSVAFSVHEINLYRQRIRYRPVNEMLLGVTSDMERALTRGLAIFSKAYLYHTGAEPADEFMLTWKEAVLTSFATLEFRINDPWNPVFDCSWFENVSYSQATVVYDIDVNAYGFRGWTGRIAKYVKLQIFPDSLDFSQANQSSLTFQLTQSVTNENQTVPVPNLTADLLLVGSYRPSMPYLPATNVSLRYMGNGTYVTTFNQGINPNTYGVSLTLATPDDKIWVSTYFYRDVYVTLNTLEENGGSRNLGRIWFADGLYSDGVLDVPFEVVPTLESESYYLEFIPEDGYVFVRWENDTSEIEVKEPTSALTAARVFGTGTITAVYRQVEPLLANVLLDSRNMDNETYSHFGNVSLNATIYQPLPQQVNGLLEGNYDLEYRAENDSYYFVTWEASTPVRPWNYSSERTGVTIDGDGNLTAVYSSVPPIFVPTWVNLASRQITLNTTNVGRIQLGPAIFILPNSASVTNGTYSLEYLATDGYDFLYWTVEGDVIVANANLSRTSVVVNGNGTITAVYNGINLLLDSREWNYTSYHDGRISLNSTAYGLPQNVTGLPEGFYQLGYIPENASDTFLLWQLEGNVSLAANPGQNTLIRVYGDANITAIYMFNNGTEPPIEPPYTGEWNSLYFDDRRTLVPGYLWSGHNGHDVTHSSTGNEKQKSLLATPIPTPTIECSQWINITMYITPVPPTSVKSIDVELGFVFDGQYYVIGNHTFGITVEQSIYWASLDVDNATFVLGYGQRVIPAGSIIQLEVVVTFIEKNGFNFIYHGFDAPSRIDLF